MPTSNAPGKGPEYGTGRHVDVTIIGTNLGPVVIRVSAVYMRAEYLDVCIPGEFSCIFHLSSSTYLTNFVSLVKVMFGTRFVAVAALCLATMATASLVPENSWCVLVPFPVLCL